MYISAPLSTEMGPATVYIAPHTTPCEGLTSAYVLGEMAALAEMPRGPLVRMHSRCDTADVLGSIDCDCHAQWLRSRQLIAEEGAGILFHFDGHEGRGAGLAVKMRGLDLTRRLGVNSVKAYQMMGVPVDQREYTHVPPFLLHFGIKSVRLLTNHPSDNMEIEGDKVASKYGTLVRGGLQVVRIPLQVGRNVINASYLDSKREVLGHTL